MGKKLKNTTKQKHDVKLPVSGMFICDVCGCEHEISYKCEECSDKAYVNTYEDVFGDITSEWAYSGHVCCNCCNCH